MSTPSPEVKVPPPSSDTVTIEVDGRKLAAKKGQMLIQVTDANGIYIPRFCYHDKLSIAANCRMCLVEVEKAPKPLPACATPVMDGMIVRTQSDKACNAQKGSMEFLLINHPLDCPICDEGGECQLQDLALGYGNDDSRYKETKRVDVNKNIRPLIATEMTRCIHCTRCERFSYQALNSAERLTAPMIRRDGQWFETDWQSALEFAINGLKQTIQAHGADQFGALASSIATTEELYLLQKFTRALGSANVDH